MCVPCSKHNHGEHCRFRKVRLVARLPSGTARSLGTFCSGAGFSLATRAAEEGGTSLAERRDATFILERTCQTFVDLLDAELALLPVDAELKVATAQLTAASHDPNADGKSTVDRSHLEGERQLCDWCGTTIMCLYHACAQCGYEACLACTGSWAAHGKPREVASVCPHALAGWTAFSRVEPGALDALRTRAEAWLDPRNAPASGVPAVQAAPGSGHGGKASSAAASADSYAPCLPLDTALSHVAKSRTALCATVRIA